MAKILVVDDEPSIVEVVELILKDKGYDVITAFDGEEALKQVRSQSPDLVVLDLKLPKMDGHAVHKALREDEKHKDIPVIMLTACGELEKMQKGMETGAVAYIMKPFDNAVLLGVIKGALK